MLDVDYDYRTVRQSEEADCPIVAIDYLTERGGGAAAVGNMVYGLGEKKYLSVFSPDMLSVKTRYWVDRQQMFRVDNDNTQAWSEDLLAGLKRTVSELTEDSVILFADYGKGAWTEDLWRDITSVAKCRIIVDPARGRPFSCYQGAYAIVPNRAEVEGKGHLEWQIFFPAICLKQDRDGMTCLTRDGERAHFHSVAKQPVVDVTGAGDAVLAGIGVALARGASWIAACRFGNAVAGAKCGKRGAVPVTLEEAQALL
jgi:D-beta-D-heptose 7-phosphate kinase/D-beta-D-heptose 1-phosphate adenosyltransferase